MSQRRFSAPLSLVALLACGSFALAQDKTQVVKDVPGPSLEAAVTNGLVRALEQVKGFRIDASIGLRKKQASETLEITNGMDKWFARLAADDASTGSILRDTSGLIRSYEILEQAQDPTTREWKVSLSVTMPVYDPENPRPGSRPTLAVVGFQTPTPSFELAGMRISAKDMNRKLLDQSEIQFVRSQKFIVLNRDLQAELGEETALIASAGMKLDEQVKLGNRMGADYIVSGNMEEFSWVEEPFEVKVTGYKGVRVSAAYDISFKVVDVATSQSRWAGNLRRVFSDDELKNLSAKDQQQNLRVPDFLVEKAAEELLTEVLGHLYPIKVAGTQEGEVVIAAGGSRVRVGDRLSVYVLGKGFEDPDTGELLGGGERKVATVSVTRVEERLSYARVTEGDLAKIEKGALCRP